MNGLFGVPYICPFFMRVRGWGVGGGLVVVARLVVAALLLLLVVIMRTCLLAC